MSGRATADIPNNYDNGRQGVQSWESYMLVKYGNATTFGYSRPYEYLIELPIYPEEVQESISAEWSEQQVLGRSANLATYAGTSLKSVNLSLNLHRDLLTGSHSLTEDEMREIAVDNGVSFDTVKKNQAAGRQYDYNDGLYGGRSWYVSVNKLLQMSCYPQYTDYGAIPPTTYFVFGSMILKGFVENYSTSWKKPLINSFYSNNTVTISMKCYPDSVISANDIYISSSSTQNTYGTKFPKRDGSNTAGASANVMGKNDVSRPNLRSQSNIGSLSSIMTT